MHMVETGKLRSKSTSIVYGNKFYANSKPENYRTDQSYTDYANMTRIFEAGEIPQRMAKMPSIRNMSRKLKLENYRIIKLLLPLQTYYVNQIWKTTKHQHDTPDSCLCMHI